MSTMAYQITSLAIVYSTVYSGVNHRKHQSSVSLAFVWRIHRCRVNSPAQSASNAETVSIWLCHHVTTGSESVLPSHVVDWMINYSHLVETQTVHKDVMTWGRFPHENYPPVTSDVTRWFPSEKASNVDFDAFLLLAWKAAEQTVGCRWLDISASRWRPANDRMSMQMERLW